MYISNIPDHLVENGIKPSYQRIKIYEYLYNNKNHPTVDMIYSNLIDHIPTLSKTTVYNTLKLFINHNIASSVTIEENEVRYDANVSSHGHFKCTVCGGIQDVEVDYQSISYNGMEGFAVQETEVFLKGTCKKCLT